MIFRIFKSQHNATQQLDKNNIYMILYQYIYIMYIGGVVMKKSKQITDEALDDILQEVKKYVRKCEGKIDDYTSKRNHVVSAVVTEEIISILDERCGRNIVDGQLQQLIYDEIMHTIKSEPMLLLNYTSNNNSKIEPLMSNVDEIAGIAKRTAEEVLDINNYSEGSYTTQTEVEERDNFIQRRSYMVDDEGPVLRKREERENEAYKDVIDYVLVDILNKLERRGIVIEDRGYVKRQAYNFLFRTPKGRTIIGERQVLTEEILKGGTELFELIGEKNKAVAAKISALGDSAYGDDDDSYGDSSFR